MNPRHRDKVAFVRVCSGKFTRDMSVFHAGADKKVRLSNSNKLFGQDRETVDEAWPGDIVGLVGHQDFKIGDTLTENPAIVFDEIPRFPPECFTFLYNPVPSKFKPFRTGLEQLILEGVVQQFTVKDAPPSTPLLAAVGPLQFEVTQYRLEAEYGVQSRLEPAPWQFVRWLDREGAEILNSGMVHLADNVRLGSDPAGNPVIFFPTPWALKYFGDTNKKITLYELPVK
jgi:peptide chain release factor 3